uniref:Sarpagan bridge enzyme n=1 Tax=Gelsemium sempervirens TaxID=28542 RepID=SBE_GELSE|nr:RecName: Full=Sarpagan bridge enzyme; Short=GsSBE; AltName: Full=Cytochrome P450 71AY5 [Gelsemium sempervirens]
MEVMQLSFSYPALFLFVFFLFMLVKQLRRPKNLPPGPNKLPIIGNLHQLATELPHHTLKQLADKYGPIMHLQFGEVSAIIVSSAKLAKVFLGNHGLAVADRPKTMVATIMLYNSSGVTFAPYGDYWKHLRQVYAVELLSPKSVRSFSMIMDEEISLMLKRIQSNAAGQPLKVHDEMMTYLFATLCRTSIGSVCKGRDLLIDTAKDISAISAAIRIEELFPSLKILPYITGLHRQLGKLSKRLDGILEDIIAQREKMQESSTGDNDERDILGVLLKLKRSNSNDTKVRIRNDDIKAIVFELILAGTLSTAATVEWCLSELKKNPGAMKKAQDEVRQVMKGETICTNDVQKLEYIRMVIKETFRMHPPAPLLFPRECREPIQVEGYTIPEKSWLIVNYWAVGRDPELWNDPEKFEPERFRNSPVDMSGNHYELIPFGAGRRICPGISFAATNAELLLASLIYHFDWKLPAGVKELDMDELFGAGCVRKNPLHLIPKTVVPCQD